MRPELHRRDRKEEFTSRKSDSGVASYLDPTLTTWWLTNWMDSPSQLVSDAEEKGPFSHIL